MQWRKQSPVRPGAAPSPEARLRLTWAEVYRMSIHRAIKVCLTRQKTYVLMSDMVEPLGITDTASVVGYNYHFTDFWYLRVDPRMAGPAWYRGFRIARVHDGDRRLEILDRDSHRHWQPVYAPGGRWTPGEAVTTHVSTHNAVETSWDILAAGDQPAELWRVSIRNTGESTRRLAVGLALILPAPSPMGCQTWWSSPDQRFFSRSVPFHGGWEEYQAITRDPIDTFVSITPQPSDVCTSARYAGAFLRGDDGAGESVATSTHGDAVAWNSVDPPAVAARWEVELAPGAVAEIHLAITRDATQPVPCGTERWQAARAAAEDYLRRYGGYLEIRTPDERLNEMVNGALRKELVWSARLWRNGISTPWRNELQDALGYALWDPDEALPFLEAVTASQEPVGYLKVWNTRPGERPNHPLVNSRHNDGGIWLILCWALYLRVTGRWDCWTHPLPFADGSVAPLSDHLLRAAQFSWNDRGAHGLVLFHDGDWTDPMNGPGRQGRGESGWATAALAVALAELAAALRLTGDPLTADTLTDRARTLHRAMVTHLWCGDRFACGMDDEGKRFGDHEDGRIFLNVQSWCMMAGHAVGDQRHHQACISAIDALRTPWGPRLLHPSFAQWDPQVGRLSLKVPGMTENGSVYCHGSAFAAWALALAGDPDTSLDIILRTLPGHPDHHTAAPGVPQQLPLYQPNSYFFEPGHPQSGTSTGTLGTGTCTWIMLTLFLHYFGISFEPSGVRVAPRLPPTWPSASLRFRRAGTDFHVTVEWGTQSAVAVHGSPVQAQPIPWANTERQVIRVTIPRMHQQSGPLEAASHP
ncbi:MAG: hypothetical protein EA403_14725 [Spirochaetaceae bacterium]|nr:MAG: hypothetical protein EA403_14725 [Spirochaetaceae bacterium]